MRAGVCFRVELCRRVFRSKFFTDAVPLKLSDYSVYPRCTSLRRFYGFSPFCYFVESITYVESIPPRGSTPTPGTNFFFLFNRLRSAILKSFARFSFVVCLTEIPGEERARRAVPYMQNLRFDLSLTVGHAEAHPRHAGVFLDPVRQGLRMRGNPELDVFRCANDQVRQGIHNVRMQGRLRFVDWQ